MPFNRHVNQGLTEIICEPSMKKTLQKRCINMPELIRGPAPWPEMHRSSCKGMLPACVSPCLTLLEWIRHVGDLSYFVAVHTVYSSGCRLQLAPQLVSLKLQ